MKPFFWLLLVVAVVMTIDFVMTNGQPVQFGSWFLPWQAEVPSGLAVLLALSLGLLVGGCLVWLAAGRARRRARQAERKVGALERELNALLQRVEGAERDAIAAALPASRTAGTADPTPATARPAETEAAATGRP